MPFEFTPLPLSNKGFTKRPVQSSSSFGIAQATMPTAAQLWTDTYIVNQIVTTDIPAPTSTLVAGTSLVISRLTISATTFNNITANVYAVPTLDTGKTYGVNMFYDGNKILIMHTDAISTVESTGITVSSFISGQPYQGMPLTITINGVTSGTPTGSAFRIKYHNADDEANATVDTSIGNSGNNYTSAAGATDLGGNSWRLDAKYVPQAGADRTWVFVEVDVADAQGNVSTTYSASINLTQIQSIYFSTFEATDANTNGAYEYSGSEIAGSSGTNAVFTIGSNTNKGYDAQIVNAVVGGFTAYNHDPANVLVDGGNYIFVGDVSTSARTTLSVFNTEPGRINGVTNINITDPGNGNVYTSYNQTFTYAQNAGNAQELVIQIIDGSNAKVFEGQYAILRLS